MPEPPVPELEPPLEAPPLVPDAPRLDAAIEPLPLEDGPELRPGEVPAASVSGPPFDPPVLDEDELFRPLEPVEQAPRVKIAMTASTAPAEMVFIGCSMLSGRSEFRAKTA
jgi:hypothetical protein